MNIGKRHCFHCGRTANQLYYGGRCYACCELGYLGPAIGLQLPKDERERRIRYYCERAERGLPLFEVDDREIAG